MNPSLFKKKIKNDNHFLRKALRKFTNLKALIVRPILFKAIIKLFRESFQGDFCAFLVRMKAIIASADISMQGVDILSSFWRQVISEMDEEEFFKRVLLCRAEKVKDFSIMPGQIKSYLNSPAWQEKSLVLKAKKIRMNGFENYSEQTGKNIPNIILGWHHGPYAAAERALTDYIPGLVRVSYGIYPYRKNISLAVAQNPAQTAYFMSQTLSAGGVLFNYFDGLYGARAYEYDLFGQKIFLATTILELARMQNALIFPFTSYINIHEKNRMDLYLGKELFERNELKSIGNEAAFSRILSFFTSNLKLKCPWGINPAILEDHRKY